MAKLYEVEPREQVGPATGNLYEYQYHQAAAGSLNLIEKTYTAACIYCEWHDYVLEADLDGRYAFFQVKTRSNGPWTVGEFFGLGKLNKKTSLRSVRKPKAKSKSKKSSIFSNLWDHTKKFGSLCQKFVFPHPNGIGTNAVNSPASRAATTDSCIELWKFWSHWSVVSNAPCSVALNAVQPPQVVGK